MVQIDEAHVTGDLRSNPVCGCFSRIKTGMMEHFD